ncbi:hypothetical protein [uncultured Campylobacter sp.]|uniref:hypothetical protein n=1 Tax=uncultured Campylobacter sp. TaxID=218934 RepID=UPI00260CE0BD|nr:hypothetical protein [uncultured Campylobacter sp.]
MRRLMFGLLIANILMCCWLLYMRPPADTVFTSKTFYDKDLIIQIGVGIIFAIFAIFILFKRENEWNEERPIARLFFILATPLTWLYYMLCNIFYGALALFEAFTTQAPKQHFK